MAVAIVTTALAVAGALAGQMRERSETVRLAKEHGKMLAGVDVSAGVQQEQLVSTAYSTLTQAKSQELTVEQNVQAVAAQKTVNAAASGTKGQSIDVGLIDADRQAAFSLAEIDVKRSNRLNQIEQASRDIEIEADLARSDFHADDASTAGRLLELFSSGVQGYLFGRQFD